jgi:membrane fusion protein (multidrug efflux system)
MGSVSAHFHRPDRTVRFDEVSTPMIVEGQMAKVLAKAGGEARRSGVPEGTLEIEARPAAKGEAERPLVGEAPASAPKEGQAPAAEQAAAAGKPRGRRKLAVAAVLALALAGGAYYGYHYWTAGRFIVSTDDAYVGADTAIIAPKVSGYVKAVAVDDNARVRAGAPLVALDDSDYRIALRQAEAQVAAQQASIARIGQQIAAGDSQVAQARAQLASAKAGAVNAQLEYDRAATLAGKAVGTKQAVDAANATLKQANAAVDAADAGVASAEANVAVLAAQKTEAERVLDQYSRAVDKAQLDLDHTIVRAPFDGVVGNRAAEAGEYVTPGTRLMALVPLQDVYVTANFKETQLEALKPGQTAAISVDAYPDHDIKGTVTSVAPASGSVFSLLPPDNATGNFTKVVQRVAVRIRVPAGVAAEDLMRPGMSVVVAVDTRTGTTGVASR